jgi:flavin-binding protein dodecin
MEEGGQPHRISGAPVTFVSGYSAQSIEAAIEAAHENAKKTIPHRGKRTFRVVDIYVTAENPVTGYSVVLETTG